MNFGFFQDGHSLKWLKLFPFLVVGSTLFFLGAENKIAASIVFFFCLLLPNFMLLDRLLGSITSKVFYITTLALLVGVTVSSIVSVNNIHDSLVIDNVIFMYFFQSLHLVVLFFSLLSFYITLTSRRAVENFAGLITSVLIFVYTIVVVIGIYSQNFYSKQIQELSIIGLNFLIVNSILIAVHHVYLKAVYSKLLYNYKFPLLLIVLFLLNVFGLACFQIYYFFTKQLLFNYFGFSLYIFAILAILLIYLLLHFNIFYSFNQSALDKNVWFCYWIVVASTSFMCLNIILNILPIYDPVIILGSDPIFIVLALIIIAFPSKSAYLLFIEFLLICVHILIDSVYRINFYLNSSALVELSALQMKYTMFWMVTLVSIKIILLTISVYNRSYSHFT